MSRPCPCCGADSDSRIPLYKVELAPIEGVTVINDYDVVQCATCGMCYASGIPHQAIVSTYYAAASKYTAVSASDRKRHENTVAAILYQIDPAIDACILDIGAGAGGLAAALRAQRPFSVASVDTLDQVIPRDFDGAVLSGVLEHVVDVQPFLRRIRQHLKPNGWLWVEVPDAGAWPDYVDHAAPFQEFSSEHVNYFTSVSLMTALHNAGFQVEGHRTDSTEQTPTQRAAHLVMWARPRALQAARAGVEAYVSMSRKRFDRYIAAAQAIPDQCILWGAGTLTRRLWPQLEPRTLFVTDSNPAYHGHQIGNCMIIAPFGAAAVARDRGIPIVACTQGSVDAIQDAAKALGVTALALLDYAKP